MQRSLAKPLMLALTLGCVSAGVQIFRNCQQEQKPSIEELQSQLDSLNQIEDSLLQSTLVVPVLRTASVQSGEGLFQTLTRAGLNNVGIIQIINAVADSVELVRLKVGDQFTVGFAHGDTANPILFRFQENPALIHTAHRSLEGVWTYKRVEKPTTVQYRVHHGTLENGSTLDGMLHNAGIPPRMVQVVNGVLMCKVPFRTHAQPGDKFKVLLEERWYQDSIWIEGKVLFAEYEGRVAGHHQAYRYEDPDPKSTYNAHYTEKGEALVYSGLRYPLDRLHIVSSYGMRLHPVTGARQMHYGVDYSGRPGTPVYAVAEGIVFESGYDPYSGNKIAIRHKDRSSSWYLHLNKKSVSRGQSVRSRQVIGTVGATGRVTGPHLHFGFKQPNGVWMNPLMKRMIATPKLEGERMRRLQDQIQEIRKILLKTEST